MSWGSEENGSGSVEPPNGSGSVELAVIVIALVIVAVKIGIVVCVCKMLQKRSSSSVIPVIADARFMTLTIDKFLNEMELEKPIRFNSQQLRVATGNFTNFLGAGGFGAVYSGIFADGITVAVKVLNGSSDKSIEAQFMAEVSTIGRTHHFNLVRLFGFCFDRDLRALVYELMPNGSLDRYLFSENKALGFDKLYEVAVGTARGITYLHEECQQRIIHYDIKPGNILLDSNFSPKVSDFGLAKLCDRDNTHITMIGGRGTPGYAAPEMWTLFPITAKCDVYSFGMLLFEILGRRNASESQEWFPKWVWNKVEKGELKGMMIVCGIEEMHGVVAKRMAQVALWCVQYRPESRPAMSLVVKMLEGLVEIPDPMNPFSHLYGNADQCPQATTETPSTTDSYETYSSNLGSQPSLLNETSLMRKYEIEFASTQ